MSVLRVYTQREKYIRVQENEMRRLLIRLIQGKIFIRNIKSVFKQGKIGAFCRKDVLISPSRGLLSW